MILCFRNCKVFKGFAASQGDSTYNCWLMPGRERECLEWTLKGEGNGNKRHKLSTKSV